jgi:hypothetical protein
MDPNPTKTRMLNLNPTEFAKTRDHLVTSLRQAIPIHLNNAESEKIEETQCRK